MCIGLTLSISAHAIECVASVEKVIQQVDGRIVAALWIRCDMTSADFYLARAQQQKNLLSVCRPAVTTIHKPTTKASVINFSLSRISRTFHSLEKLSARILLLI